MSNTDLVTIVIVTYNAGLTLKNAIDSVVRQTYGNIECIVVDGKSTDNTIDILKEYEQKVHYISEEDDGIFDAMNKGVKIASGEWILFLGADDVLLPNAISAFISKSGEADILYGDYYTQSLKGEISKKESLLYSVVVYKAFTTHQAVLMKTSVVKALNGFDINFRLCADFDLIQRAYLQHYSFLHISEYIVKYNLGGVSTNNFSVCYEWWKICRKNKSVLLPLGAFAYYALREFKNRLIK